MTAGTDRTDTGYFFADHTGQPRHPSAITTPFHRIGYEVGPPPIRFHDTRHCAGCLMHATGADIEHISAALGHSIVADTCTTILAEASHTTAHNTADPITELGTPGFGRS